MQRGLLLYEVAAGDAFPIMGLANGYGDYAAGKERLLCDAESIVLRFREAPERLPLPRLKTRVRFTKTRMRGNGFLSLWKPKQLLDSVGCFNVGLNRFLTIFWNK
jgi:hypothetical protein